ncbi:MAG: tryptophan--tRNA ligase, partial [Bacilli bacterium]|nr:tryptophan--tRNA ligase [Bacilli bacterium]
RADIPGTVDGNLVFLYHDLFNDNSAEVKELKNRYQAGTISDVEVKAKLIEALDRFLTPIRKRYHQYNDPTYLDNLIIEGNKKVQKIVQTTLKEIKEAMGFYS